jgi:hypothetical protein
MDKIFQVQTYKQSGLDERHLNFQRTESCFAASNVEPNQTSSARDEFN